MAYSQHQYRAHPPRPQASSGPRQIVAKYPSVCKHCQRPINVGDVILWSAGQPAVHPGCAQTHLDVAPGGVYAAPVPAEGERLYTCTKRGCRNQGILWVSATPAASRLATGRPILCPVCGDCAVLKPASTIAPAPAPAAQSPAPVAEIVRLEVEDAGVYVLPDGTIVKVQANKEKTRVYAKKWIVISGERLTEADTREHGEYEYAPGLLPQVEREGVRMTLEQAKAFTLRFGICARCGRHLKAAESVERGIGPVCWKWFEGGHSH